MSKNSEAVKRWRRNAKARIIRAFGGKCSICGYDKCQEAFDFHHLDPSQKETHWGAIRSDIKGWNTIVAEMEKCVMLCSNCHKEVHAGMSSVPHDAPRFDNSLSGYRGEERKLYYDQCPVCGGDKRVIYKTCGKQACRVTTRKVKIVDWNKVSVRELYRQHGSFAAVGDILGVSGAAVARVYKREQKVYGPLM